MSTPVNPSCIMIYKIVKDYENGKTINSFKELNDFSNAVLEFANSITDEGFWVAHSNENHKDIKSDLSKLCDLTTSLCEVNEFKYHNDGQNFANKKIGAMPYSLLKGVVVKYQELQNQSGKDEIMLEK